MQSARTVGQHVQIMSQNLEAFKATFKAAFKAAFKEPFKVTDTWRLASSP